MRRGRGRRVQGNGMLYMLALHAASQFMQLPRKPPVTAALILANTLVYLRPGKLDDALPALSEVCLNPHLVLKDWDLKRLVLSAFYHVDESHLVYNMMSLLWKGVQLEGRMGSKQFAKMVAVLLVMSHSLLVVSAKLLASFTDSTGPLYSECAVGFSAVLFALKVVLNWTSPSHTNVYGVLVPSRYAAWVELILIQMFVPGTSFLGHLCGILAGLIYVNAPQFLSGSGGPWQLVRRPLSLLLWPFTHILRSFRRRTYGHGVVGSRRNQLQPDSQQNRRGRRDGRLQGDGDGVWRCQVCTFDNGVAVSEACEMCGTLWQSGVNRVELEETSPTAPPWPVRSFRSPSSLSVEELRQARLSRFNRR